MNICKLPLDPWGLPTTCWLSLPSLSLLLNPLFLKQLTSALLSISHLPQTLLLILLFIPSFIFYLHPPTSSSLRTESLQAARVFRENISWLFSYPPLNTSGAKSIQPNLSSELLVFSLSKILLSSGSPSPWLFIVSDTISVLLFSILCHSVKV